MKNLKLILLMVMLMVGIACKSNRTSQSITIKNSVKVYSLEADYPERKTNQLFRFIENTLNNHQLFGQVTEKEFTEIVLPDETKFKLAYQPGYIKIQFNKDENSEASYRKMKSLYSGITKILK